MGQFSMEIYAPTGSILSGNLQIKALFRQTVEVQQCYYVTGNGGFVLIVSVPDMASYEVLARSLFADNDAVSTYRTLVVLDAVKAPAAP
jgi:Lrp/AsnC family leucine-responsive transcriptional regulator